jgi:hypothetical protein
MRLVRNLIAVLVLVGAVMVNNAYAWDNCETFGMQCEIVVGHVVDTGGVCYTQGPNRGEYVLHVYCLHDVTNEILAETDCSYAGNEWYHLGPFCLMWPNQCA